MRKMTYFAALALLCACSESVNTTPGEIIVEDGSYSTSTCLDGATIWFEPTIGGEGTDVEITVDTDFGDTPADFSVPFTCSFETGVDPDRTSRCSSVVAENEDLYQGWGDGEVGPPIVVVDATRTDDGDSHAVAGIYWGHLSEEAHLTIKREGEIVFDDDVELEDTDCEGYSFPIKEATVSLDI